ncbi:MAG TPA: bifunctional pyr operon transcriptional regulator/uracil phosphoribosyltransferase PyrR [Polyangiaceae bacterium]|jgi:pyrimidine operon attenuation protein/uracil phosphoribosyltransferase|nr:bifunctional pyr operon transcriptional regulator/uracil phosphoribosyltransferase PyrR [Polyangiaceae bacterium]
MRLILDAEQVTLGIANVAREVLARHPNPDELVLIGIRRGGVPLAARLAEALFTQSGKRVGVGSVDITLYRDDAATALPNPRIGPSQMPGSIDGKCVILVDDVLFTRRTIRAAFDALFDHGRPAKIELFVLVDRAGAQLPIQPDYRVCKCDDVSLDERVDVVQQAGSITALVQPKSAPSIPPPAP